MAAILSLLGLASPLHAEFGFRKKITIDRTKVGCAGTSATTISNFPILYSVTDADLKTTGNGGDVTDADGDDIIFRDSNGATQIPHEIEKYVASTGQLIAWVKVPSIKTNHASNTSDSFIYIYYGNSAISSSTQNPTDVWDSGHKGVWHLNESSGTRYDSTTNNNDLAASGTVTASSGGKAGGAIDLEVGSEGSLYIADNASLSITGNLTISAWIKLESLPSVEGDEMAVVSKWTSGQYSYSLYIEPGPENGSNDVVRIKFSHNGSSQADADGDDALSTGTWYHVAAVYDATDFRVYLNGAVDTTGDNPQAYSSGIYDGTAEFHIGRRPDGAGEMDGLIDEVQVSAAARDCDWIKTSYNNQNAPGDIGSPNFYSVGTEETTFVTDVALTSFRARARPASVLIEWRTAHEIGNLGFLLHRARDPLGPFVIISSGIIPGLLSSAQGKAYEYSDTDIIPGTVYYYMLEQIDLSGGQEFFGPIKVDRMEPVFIRGDVNADGRVDIGDAIRSLGYQFGGASDPACAKAADVDDDGAVGMADIVALLQHLFIPASQAPPPPYPECGRDGTPDRLSCPDDSACP